MQADFVNGGVHRWALPSDSNFRCSCTKILAKPVQSSCGFLYDVDIGGYWFTDYPGILADRNVWNTEKLKYLLDCPYKGTKVAIKENTTKRMPRQIYGYTMW